MVSKVCSRSQGQPPGDRRRAMISIKRAKPASAGNLVGSLGLVVGTGILSVARRTWCQPLRTVELTLSGSAIDMYQRGGAETTPSASRSARTRYLLLSAVLSATLSAVLLTASADL